MTTEEIKVVEEWFESEGYITEYQAKHLIAEVKKLRELLEMASEYMRHDEGCSAPFGYKCKCGLDRENPKIEEALK